MKLTKIIATVGPAIESEEEITKLIDLGVNIFRFNAKHNDLEWHKEKIKLVKKIAKEKNKAIGTLLDLQGPEIRTVLPVDEISLDAGEKITVGDSKFNISHPEVLSHLSVGQEIVVEDGRARFTVEKKGKRGVVLSSKTKQILRNKKTFNIPGASYPMPLLTQKDLEAIKIAKVSQVDFVALSFVRSAKDIADLKQTLKKEGVKTKVISKIETRLALDNLDEIIEVSNALMVARGDLGIEIPIEQVPYYQKLMIKKCLERGIPVITATQMLISMIDKPYPTRAEVSDIANAAYDLTDAVMLSEETAMGSHPEEAVTTMAGTVKFSERQNILKDTRTVFDFVSDRPQEMLCDTAYNLYLQFERRDQPIGGFIVFSETGRTARTISRYRPKVPIFVFAPNEKVRDALTINFGVEPLVQPTEFETELTVRLEDMKEAFKYLVAHEHVNPDMRYILLYGDNWGIEGGVSTIKIVYPKNLE